MTDLARLTILVIEDDADARELMQAVLEGRGATVLLAESVARAFDLIDVAVPDVVVSDIAMPDEDGIAFIRRLRARSPERGGRTPAIAVSAYVATSDRTRALSAGFDHYLFKPVEFEALVVAIRSVLAEDDKATA
jgi:CheY-like chemotaxis protein